MSKKNNLKDYLTDLYEGIVSKKPNASRNPQNFRAEIESIVSTGEDANELYNRGYAEGKQAEYDAFWDAFQQNGNRTNYENAFSGQSFDFTNFFPKYDIRPTGYTEGTFYAWERASHSGSLVQRLKECRVVLDTSKCTHLGRVFAFSQITEIPTIDCTGLTANTQQVFAHNYGRLNKIQKLIVKEGIEFTNWFINTDIEEVIFEGVISTGSLNLQWAKRLNKASWISIINTLSASTTGLSMTGSLESVNTAFETSAGAKDGSTSTEWLNLIATKSNWTINFV